MASINKKREDSRFEKEVRLAGGAGMKAAVQDAEMQLRRAVLANVLWEDTAYQSGAEIASQIATLVPQVDPNIVAGIAVEARTHQKLRHVPLLIAREMVRHASHKGLVGSLLPQIIRRADEMAEFLAIYWKDGKTPIANQVKKGLAASFDRFDEYQFAKYNRDKAVRLRDAMFMVHPNPGKKADLFKRIAEDTLAVPDTWETALSAGKDKKATWERLISENKLPALAFIRNLRNMEEAKVSHEIIEYGFARVNPTWLLPINFVAAADQAPRWERQLEELMFRCLENAPRLTGHSIFVVDVSGSMGSAISAKSTMGRYDAAAAMAMLAERMCESVSIYATAGSDARRVHATKLIPARRGFGLRKAILEDKLGGGGIFTRQCLEYIRGQEQRKPARIIVFSDSQDCDRVNKVPAPFGDYNYIVDVSSHTHGINYKGVWTAEISGFSERFLDYIAAFEGLSLQEDQE